MIELQVSGPKKQKIIDFLRNKSKADQNSLQMIRISPQKLYNFETKKTIKLTFPSLSKQLRKNDYIRPLSLSIANQLGQKSYISQIKIEENQRSSFQSVNRKLKDKQMPQRKVKSHLQIFRPLHRSQQIIKKNISSSKKSPNNKVVTALSNNIKRYLQADIKRKSSTIEKVSKPLLFHLSSREQKQISKQLPKNLQISKRQIRYQNIEKISLKSKDKFMEGYLDNGMSENVSRILRSKNQDNQKLKNHILRRIRSKQSSSKLKDSKLMINESMIFKTDVSQCEQSIRNQFQKSLGPWRDSEFIFEQQST